MNKKISRTLALVLVAGALAVPATAAHAGAQSPGPRIKVTRVKKTTRPAPASRIKPSGVISPGPRGGG
jgi:hypothetical protein